MMKPYNIEMDHLALAVFIVMYIKQRYLTKTEKDYKIKAYNAVILISAVGAAAEIAASCAAGTLLGEAAALLRCAAVPAVIFAWLYGAFTAVYENEPQKIKKCSVLAAIPCVAVAVFNGIQVKQAALFTAAGFAAVAVCAFICVFVVLGNTKKFEQKSTAPVLLTFPAAAVTGALIELVLPGATVVFSLFAVAYVCVDAVAQAEQNKHYREELKKKISAIERVAEKADKTDAENDARVRFMSQTCRDMRYSVNGLRGLVTRAAKNPQKEEREEIHAEGRCLISTLNDLLDFNELMLGRLEIHTAAIDPLPLSDEIDKDARRLAQAKGVTFSMNRNHPEKMTPVILIADDSRVKQLFLNLIVGLAEHTATGGEVSLTVERLETEDDYVTNRYVFSGTGVSISSESLRRVFEPFLPDNPSGTEQKSRAELSLSIACLLAKLMDGELTAQSEQGEGTSFVLTMRFKRYKNAENMPKPANTLSIRFDGVKILLCEDNAVNSEIAVKLLENKGALVTVAENGKQGVQVFSESPEAYYNLVLMDVRMPQMNGLEATKAIRSLNRPDAATVTIIAMTADIFDEDIAECLAAGMNDHISKPLEVDKMYLKIERYTSHKAYF